MLQLPHAASLTPGEDWNPPDSHAQTFCLLGGAVSNREPWGITVPLLEGLCAPEHSPCTKPGHRVREIFLLSELIGFNNDFFYSWEAQKQPQKMDMKRLDSLEMQFSLDVMEIGTCMVLIQQSCVMKSFLIRKLNQTEPVQYMQGYSHISSVLPFF